MFKRFIPALVVLFALLASTLPAYATSGDAKLTVHDNTNNVNLVVCYTDVSPCSIWLVAGRNYTITLQELSDQQFSSSILDVDNVSAWSAKEQSWSYNASQCTINPVTYVDTTRWTISTRTTPDNTNCVYYTGLTGTASSGSDGSITARLDKYPTGYKWVTVLINTP